MEFKTENINKQRFYRFLDGNGIMNAFESQFGEDNVFVCEMRYGAECGFEPANETQRKLRTFLCDCNRKKITHAKWIEYCCIVDALEDEMLADKRFNPHEQMFELDDIASRRRALEYLLEHGYGDEAAYMMLALMMSNQGVLFNSYPDMACCPENGTIAIYGCLYYVCGMDELERRAVDMLERKYAEAADAIETEMGESLREFLEGEVKEIGAFAFLNPLVESEERLNVIGRELCVLFGGMCDKKE